MRVILVLLLFFAPEAKADVIFPIFAYKPGALVLFAPLIAVEYFVMLRYFRNSSRKEILKAAIYSNICSTVVGYPILVIVSFPIGLFTELFLRRIFHGPWYPYAAFFIVMMLLLALCLSVCLEKLVVNKYLKEPNISRTVWLANLACQYRFLYFFGNHRYIS